MKVGVVGAGLMGGEIALTFALAGDTVILHDLDQVRLEQTRTRLRTIVDKGAARGAYTDDQRDFALTRILATTRLEGMAECDLVTEAVFESADVKQSVLQSLDAICAPSCVFASNTSTLPISTLAAALSPSRRPTFVGTHYFSPVSRMALVEVIPGFETSAETTAFALEATRRIGKSPVLVKDVAGFAVNRMLHAMLIEAVKLVEEGVATPQDLDIACKLGLGHPVGPFTLMDAVSSGLCVQVQDILHEAYGERFRPPALLKQRVAAGYGGGKGQPGWLDHH